MPAKNELRKVSFSKHRADPEKLGYFHQWGSFAHPLDNGLSIPETAGIIEREDGSIEVVPPAYIRFIND
jgi:hypothetical protein